MKISFMIRKSNELVSLIFVKRLIWRFFMSYVTILMVRISFNNVLIFKI
jgi:hypothetical protein